MKITGYRVMVFCLWITLSSSIAAGGANRFAGGPFRTSEKGFFKVALISAQGGFKAGANTADIIVHDMNGLGVKGAKITMTPWMPDMGHGSPEQPVITEKGGGMFEVENIVFNMGGYWELRMEIVKDGIEDSVVFIFPDVKE